MLSESPYIILYRILLYLCAEAKRPIWIPTFVCKMQILPCRYCALVNIRIESYLIDVTVNVVLSNSINAHHGWYHMLARPCDLCSIRFVKFELILYIIFDLQSHRNAHRRPPTTTDDYRARKNDCVLIVLVESGSFGERINKIN